MKDTPLRGIGERMPNDFQNMADEPMTRSEAVLMLYRMAGSPPLSGGEMPFTDVSFLRGDYAAVAWAYRNGLLQGIAEPPDFRPDAVINRGEAVMLLYHFHQMQQK